MQKNYGEGSSRIYNKQDDDSGNEGDERESVNFTIIGAEGLKTLHDWNDIAHKLGKQGAKTFLFKKGMEAIVVKYKRPTEAEMAELKSEFKRYLKEIRL